MSGYLNWRLPSAHPSTLKWREDWSVSFTGLLTRHHGTANRRQHQGGCRGQSRDPSINTSHPNGHSSVRVYTRNFSIPFPHARREKLSCLCPGSDGLGRSGFITRGWFYVVLQPHSCSQHELQKLSWSFVLKCDPACRVLSVQKQTDVVRKGRLLTQRQRLLGKHFLWTRADYKWK